MSFAGSSAKTNTRPCSLMDLFHSPAAKLLPFILFSTDRPFQILKSLLDRPGELVTREELRHKLWGDDTFVDFDRGLNTAVTKLRVALGDLLKPHVSSKPCLDKDTASSRRSQSRKPHFRSKPYHLPRWNFLAADRWMYFPSLGLFHKIRRYTPCFDHGIRLLD